MEDLEVELLRSLASETRIKIVRLLKDGVDHPEDLAKEVGVVRQAIDKHLLDMHSLGLVERSAHFPHTGRPRVVYSLTPRGARLYNSMATLVAEFRVEMVAQHAGMKHDLDTMLINGQIGEPGYKKKLAELNERFAVVLEEQTKVESEAPKDE